MSTDQVDDVPVVENKNANARLPSSRVDKVLRKKFVGKRLASATPKYVTAVVENILAEIAQRAGEAAKAEGKKRATLQHLMRAVRADRGSSKFFRAYVFASANNMKFNSLALLNSKDREVALKKRAQAKEKKDGAAVPSIDQE
jgi:histone H3/H4